MKVNDSLKHSSLLRYVNNYGRKSFIVQASSVKVITVLSLPLKLLFLVQSNKDKFVIDSVVGTSARINKSM